MVRDPRNSRNNVLVKWEAENKGTNAQPPYTDKGIMPLAVVFLSSRMQLVPFDVHGATPDLNGAGRDRLQASTCNHYYSMKAPGSPRMDHR